MSFLKQTWLFAELDATETARLAAAAVLRTAPAGQLLFCKGDPTPGLHLVETGSIKLYTLTEAGDERIIDFIGPGEICGEMGVVDAAPSMAWGESLEPVRYWVIPPAEFERVLLGNPNIAVKLCRVLVAKLRVSSRQLEETIFLSSRERVLNHLLRLAKRHGRPGEQGVLVGLRLTHLEIARLAGTARETVSRVLAELQDRGLLKVSGRQLCFPSLDGLQKLAGERQDS